MKKPSSKFLSTILLASSALSSAPSQARSLSEYRYFRYELRFANPTCREYRYPDAVRSRGGNPLAAKPKDAYCRPEDALISEAREDGPITGFIQWIRDPSAREIFIATPGFSHAELARELCSAIQARSLKLTLVVDASSQLDPIAAHTQRLLMSCRPASRDPKLKPELVYGNGVRNRIFLVNPTPVPRSNGVTRVAFGSSPLTAGFSLNHQSWHFITTDERSHFAQAHLCLMKSLINHSKTLSGFSSALRACRAEIKTAEESDVQAFFTPTDSLRMVGYLNEAARRSQSIAISASRFSLLSVGSMLAAKLRAQPATLLRFVTDDDTFWAGVSGLPPVALAPLGPMFATLPIDYQRMQGLYTLGARIRYMETNHGIRQFFREKFVLFDRGAVLTGSGDLTADSLNDGIDSFYFITFPFITERYRLRYEHLWANLATSPEDMPERDLLP